MSVPIAGRPRLQSAPCPTPHGEGEQSKWTLWSWLRGKGTDCVQAHPKHHLCPRNAANQQPGWVMRVGGSVSDRSYTLRLEPQAQGGGPAVKPRKWKCRWRPDAPAHPPTVSQGCLTDSSIAKPCELNLTYVPICSFLICQMVSHSISQCQHVSIALLWETLQLSCFTQESQTYP